MQKKLGHIYKVIIFGGVAYLISFCAIRNVSPEWADSNWLAIAIDSTIFAKLFNVSPHVHHLLVVSVMLWVGTFVVPATSSYVKKLFNSFLYIGLSWHHYLFASLVGASLAVTTFVGTSSDFDTWYWFAGDGFLLVLIFLIYGVFILPVDEVAEPEAATLPEDIINVSILVEYITRRVEGAYNTHQGPLPKTLAISGERGSGKSYVLEKVKVKLVTEGFKCKIFKPWNFDSHTLFYEEVMGYLFSVLEEKYVVPKPKALVNNYIRSFCDEPKKIVGAFSAHLMGDFSSEKRSLQDAETWIRKIGKVVLVFDDLDRCHQSELRSVFRLMDRLTLFENVFIIASIDERTLDKIAKFEMRTEIPVKVTS